MQDNRLHLQDLEKINRYNFRALCDALSKPGNTYHLRKAFDSYRIACASVLLYSEVSYINLTNEDFWALHSLCNAKQTNIGNADYIFTDDLDSNILSNVKRGSFKDPEFSATIIFCFDDTHTQKEYRLEGAGIDGHIIQKYPLDKDLMQEFLHNNKYFPMGNEIYFLNTQSGEIKALSRTTKMEVV